MKPLTHPHILSKLERKYKKHIENAYSFKYTDPSASDYFEFKAYKTLAKIQFLMRASA
jgi:hypothetical protein